MQCGGKFCAGVKMASMGPNISIATLFVFAAATATTACVQLQLQRERSGSGKPRGAAGGRRCHACTTSHYPQLTNWLRGSRAVRYESVEQVGGLRSPA
jgi:hypothetical protein